MNYQIAPASETDKELLAEVRVASMKESLENIGRFDPKIARNRFLDSYIEADTKKIIMDNKVVGFYVIRNKSDHVHLDHLYILPEYQGAGLGTKIIGLVKSKAQENCLPIRLCALRDSRSNEFYKKHGFSYTHEEEWDIYYEFTHE